MPALLRSAATEATATTAPRAGYVDGTQNSNADTGLNNWYIADRILHNDAFYVDIRS
ncbi:hypothetical protein [Streptomyces sp. 5-6(2022)]|uniref:hypothetical protein n=1 Tax=Streptomyces sp. 5-6(2022) TaxID=2936510 RepID=UPI0023B971DC|nr:hypothetical protein [Streptomyces sp. 5-6(2022)]